MPVASHQSLVLCALEALTVAQPAPGSGASNLLQVCARVLSILWNLPVCVYTDT
jgi:hypothetical protein